MSSNPRVDLSLEQLFRLQDGELTLEEWEARPLAAKVSEAIIAPLRPLL